MSKNLSPYDVMAGGPCTCAAGRYVRFVIPRGLRGADAVISCRSNDGVGLDSIREHSLPPGAQVYVRVPSILAGGS